MEVEGAEAGQRGAMGARVMQASSSFRQMREVMQTVKATHAHAGSCRA